MGRTTPATTAGMSRSWKIDVCQKNKTPLKILSISNHQQGARRVRSYTNLFFSYVPSRPLALDRQTTTATESGTTETTKNTAYIYPQNLLGGKKHKQMRYQRNACHHWFLPWTLPTYYHLGVEEERYFLLILVSKMYSLFLVHPLPMPYYNKSQTKSMLCVVDHRCVCSY